MNVPIEVLKSFEPPDINVTIYMDKLLTPEQEKRVESLIINWYKTGVEDGMERGFYIFFTILPFVMNKPSL